MKKSKFMRVAAVLMAAVLLTTCAISGTFAKYVTTGAGTTSSARVAKWGVAITASGDSAFSPTYAADDAGAISANTVIADDGTATLVAPGTSGTAVSVGITGTPEVEVAVTYTATITATGWTVSAAEYFPIIFTVGGDTYGITGMKDGNGVAPDHDYATIALLTAAVEDAIEVASSHYAPNTNLATATNADMTITWEWAFEGNDDAKDTALGDLAAAGTAPTISIATTATVTQVD